MKLVVSTLVINLALSLAASSAFAWGHLKEFNTPWAPVHLVFAASERGAIKYCIAVDLLTGAGFEEESLNIQTEAALQAWLNPVQEKDLVGNVDLIRVGCDTSEFDLKILVGPDREYMRLGAYQLETEQNGHRYTLVKINTLYRTKGYTSIRDFKELLRIDKQMDLVQTLDHFSLIQGYSVYDFAEEAKVAYVPLFWSTYRILLHELGHSFGLCDTTVSKVNEFCDSNFLTPVFEKTVMSDSNYLSLTQDDEDGIVELFRRFPSRQPVLKLKNPLKIFPAVPLKN
jgi:hypothetical protein